MRGSWRTTRRASASCSSRAATSVKPILLLLLLAPPGDADRPVLFQHIPGTGGSSLMTALRRYGCARGLSLCPVVGGVRKHGPEDPRWASVAAYDVVASHLPSVDAADAWRLSHPGGRVLTVLRDPVVYAHKHDPGAAPRLDAQYQYLRHGWRRDAAAEPRAEMSPADARAFLRARFDVVGVLGAGTATHLFDAFVIRAGLALSGEPDALLYVRRNVRDECAAPRRLGVRSREMRSWGLLANELRPAPNAAAHERRVDALVVGLGEAWRNGSRAALRAALGPGGDAAARLRAAARLVDDADLRLPADVALVVAALADYADGDDWARHGATFASQKKSANSSHSSRGQN